MKRHARQRGVALITAVLVVAIATLLIAGLLDRGDVALARTRNLTRGAQADALAMGVEDWALAALRQDAITGDGRDTRDDSWAQALPPTPVPGGVISGLMRDLNGCLNLNNLVRGDGADEIELARFTRLLEILKLDPALAPAVVDWLDPNLLPETRGAEDQAYAAARPPYRAANRFMSHISELRLVRGVDDKVYQALLPHVCATPPGSPINLNTASLEVIRALSPNMDETSARQLSASGASYGSVVEFQERLQKLALAPVPDLHLDVKSTVFRAQANIELDGIPIVAVSLLQRDRGRLRVIARGRGEF